MEATRTVADGRSLCRCSRSDRFRRPPAIRRKQALLAKREQLEAAIDRLKFQKAAMPTDEYKRQLQALLLDLARTQAEIDK